MRRQLSVKKEKKDVVQQCDHPSDIRMIRRRLMIDTKNNSVVIYLGGQRGGSPRHKEFRFAVKVGERELIVTQYT